MRVLILGGTAEARELAERCAGLAGVRAVTSLAGRVTAPRRPAGDLRVGGFGGVDGLAGYLNGAGIDAVVDASHPFAAAITRAAVEASRLCGVPLLVLNRDGWVPGPGDLWHRVASLTEAAAVVGRLGRRAFLATGRGSVAAFAGVDECWFLIRSVEAPEPPLPRHAQVVLDRGPFTHEGEVALLAGHRIDVLVTKDSGGELAAAKLGAARELGIPVVIVDRPALPAGVRRVAAVSSAVAWLCDLAGAAGRCP